MSTSDMTADEAFGSLNYFEIQDMKRHFGVSLAEIESLVDSAMYALIFVVEKRTNPALTPDDVKRRPFSGLLGYFAEPADDRDPLAEESGKGEAATVA